jgi:hypothetical protein
LAEGLPSQPAEESTTATRDQVVRGRHVLGPLGAEDTHLEQVGGCLSSHTRSSAGHRTRSHRASTERRGTGRCEPARRSSCSGNRHARGGFDRRLAPVLAFADQPGFVLLDERVLPT